MAKFTYRGLGIEELLSMSDAEVIKVFPARQRRTLSRGQVKNNPALFKKINEAIKQVKEEQPQKNVKTHLRSLVIMPRMVGLTIQVHSGNEFKKIVIKEKMIGHYISEYALTRKMVKHSSPGVGASRSSKAASIK
ncbi:MAG: 30S ribosomal protein S19 [Candidatus Nanoarchaeia archaeon]|jgi:small subunit ribosomal protein S19